MDDENRAQESYFTAYAAVINNLDPKAGDFEFQAINLRHALQNSHFFTLSEKEELLSMLHIAQTKSTLA
jgi:hypothetical protein